MSLLSASIGPASFYCGNADNKYRKHMGISGWETARRNVWDREMNRTLPAYSNGFCRQGRNHSWDSGRLPSGSKKAHGYDWPCEPKRHGPDSVCFNYIPTSIEDGKVCQKKDVPVTVAITYSYNIIQYKQALQSVINHRKVTHGYFFRVWRISRYPSPTINNRTHQDRFQRSCRC